MKKTDLICILPVAILLIASTASAQLLDRTKTPNPLNEGIAKSLAEEIGAGRGDVNTPDSSAFIIMRDPFRAIRRGRQLFQRKFQHLDGATGTFYARDGSGDILSNPGIGAGFADSCATCHGRPRGSAGFGGDVVTRPDSRDAPHLFGIGLKEMLADEITTDLRAIRDDAAAAAKATGQPVSRPLTSKGIGYGLIQAFPNGAVSLAGVEGVDDDLRVRPLFAHGEVTSIRELIVAAMHNELGFQMLDPELANAASLHQRYVTPAGMVLDGKLDPVIGPPPPDPSTVTQGQAPPNQLPTAVVDYLEFYLLNYFKPAQYEQSTAVLSGRQTFETVGCVTCHIANLQINRDRRVADLETVYDAARGNFNHLFATATPLIDTIDDHSGLPVRKVPQLKPFLVKNIFTDFKRHELGPNFWERNYDGSYQKQFLTTPLWGVGTTAPYGHDGRSTNLTEVILRHGGEAQSARDAFAALSSVMRSEVLDFLQSLVIFPPDDTASTLDPGDRFADGFPQVKHGSIKLTVLFNDPKIVE